MPPRLTGSERSRLRGIVKRPRSRKQLYRAKALLFLNEGQPVEAVARGCRVSVDKVESWIEGFEKLRIAFLEEPSAGRPAIRRESSRVDEREDEG